MHNYVFEKFKLSSRPYLHAFFHSSFFLIIQNYDPLCYLPNIIGNKHQP